MGVVSGDRDRDDRGDCGTALAAAGRLGVHLVGGVGGEHQVVRSREARVVAEIGCGVVLAVIEGDRSADADLCSVAATVLRQRLGGVLHIRMRLDGEDRKSIRLNSSHGYISYAVFCLKK